MARLYIANVTRQKHVVCYRLDFNDSGERNLNARFQPARQQEIDPGRQVQIGADFHMTQINDIVDQLARYGLIGCVDVPKMDRTASHPYVYNIDAPVPAGVMRQVQANNESIVVDHGRERRKKAAVATNDIVQRTVALDLAEKGLSAPEPTGTDLSFEQEEQSEAGERRIEEGFRVRSEPKASAGKRRKR